VFVINVDIERRNFIHFLTNINLKKSNVESLIMFVYFVKILRIYVMIDNFDAIFFLKDILLAILRPENGNILRNELFIIKVDVVCRCQDHSRVNKATCSSFLCLYFSSFWIILFWDNFSNGIAGKSIKVLYFIALSIIYNFVLIIRRVTVDVIIRIIKIILMLFFHLMKLNFVVSLLWIFNKFF
jgi:hypothetical protein